MAIRKKDKRNVVSRDRKVSDSQVLPCKARAGKASEKDVKVLSKTPYVHLEQKEMSLAVRAAVSLGLPRDYELISDVQAIINEGGIGAQVYSFLQNSKNENIRKLLSARRKLTEAERSVITIDHLILAVGLDPAETIGIVQAEVYRAKGASAALLGAVAGPEVMAAVVERAKDRINGHSDSKLLLQINGNAPVPKNQVTNITVRDNQIDASKHQHNYAAPSLEDVVRSVDSVLTVAAEPMARAALPPIRDEVLEG